MKRIFTLLATCWVIQKAMAAFIPAGTVLYLDASKAWTNETSITARFSSDGMSAQEVAMTRTAGEQHIWQVSAPTPGPWTVVTFQSISGYQTAELIWGGYQSLYVVTCDACGSGQKAAGEWRYFTPLPEQNPGQLGIDYTDSIVCADLADSTITLSVGTTQDYLYSQWFAYTASAWTRIEGTPEKMIASLPADTAQDIWFLFTGLHVKKDGVGVVNGDFEQGNTGFYTDYSYRTPVDDHTLYDEGVYTITNDVRQVHTSAPSPACSHDHTTGSGMMMAVNGGSDVNKTVWQQTVMGLNPQTSYVFSAWVMNWDQENSNMAKLEFSINGQLQGGRVSPQGGYGHWTQVYAVWNSGTSDQANIRLVNFQDASYGNDFAVDDISLSELVTENRLFRFSFKSCDPPLPECTNDLVYRKWNDVLFCDNHDSTLVSWQWYLDSVAIEGATKQFLYMPDGMAPGEYYVIARCVDGQLKVSCPITFEEAPRSAVSSPKIPSHVAKKEPIRIQMNGRSAELNIYDMMGRRRLLIYTRGEDIELPHHLDNGMYIILLQMGNESVAQRIRVW